MATALSIVAAPGALYGVCTGNSFAGLGSAPGGGAKTAAGRAVFSLASAPATGDLEGLSPAIGLGSAEAAEPAGARDSATAVLGMAVTTSGPGPGGTVPEGPAYKSDSCKAAVLGARANRFATDEVWIRADGVFEPLVDRALFEAARAIITDRSKKLTNEEMLAALHRLLEKRGYWKVSALKSQIFSKRNTLQSTHSQS